MRAEKEKKKVQDKEHDIKTKNEEHVQECTRENQLRNKRLQKREKNENKKSGDEKKKKRKKRAGTG